MERRIDGHKGAQGPATAHRDETSKEQVSNHELGITHMGTEKKGISTGPGDCRMTTGHSSGSQLCPRNGVFQER